ncbi:MAG: hypothetical protein Q9167_004880 [Letrouitia subvulpina]
MSESRSELQHGQRLIERVVPVESLIKCKMQDNLEFLQWTKRFWDQYYPGGEYDAVVRRKGSGNPVTTAATPVTTSRTSGAGAAKRGTTPIIGAARKGVVGGSTSMAVIQEINELKERVFELERERDFYFNKLREIEVLIQEAVEEDPDIEKESGIVKRIQNSLYSTAVQFALTEEQYQSAH